MKSSIQIGIALASMMPEVSPVDLAAEDRTRLERISHSGRRQVFIAGRYLLNAMLPGCLPEIRIDAAGKPMLEGHDQPAFSISHSGGRVVCAVTAASRQAIPSIGIDLERRQFRPRLFGAVKQFFHPDEAAWLATRPRAEQPDAFYRIWTIKEAIGKGRGNGISGFREFSVLSEHGMWVDAGMKHSWSFRHWSSRSGWHMALAWKGEEHCSMELDLMNRHGNFTRCMNLKEKMSVSRTIDLSGF